jgi:hypothetical protein
MDLVVDLPLSPRKSSAILTVVDRFSKMAHFVALPTDTSAPSLAQTFIASVIRYHGFPKSIVSDRDPRFMSKFWSSLWTAMGCELLPSTSFHPQTDG